MLSHNLSTTRYNAGMTNAHTLKIIVATLVAVGSSQVAVHAASPAAPSHQDEITLPEFTQTTLKNGWVEYASEEEGFSVALPAAWFNLKNNSPELISQGM